MNIIQIYARARIKDGKLGALTSVLEGAAEATKGHDGIVNYQFFVSDEGTVLHGIEAYRDSAALGAHMAAVGESLGVLFELVESMEVTVFGDVSDELRAGLAAMSPKYGRHLAGFTP